jgi:iron complex transport system substrate-binding protein
MKKEMKIREEESGNKKTKEGDKKKMKTKTLALAEIAIVLCSVFLVALPAIAAEQTTKEVSASANAITTASEDDFVLGVYGNANEDDTIDMRDLTYVKLIFFGKKPETELADAKYDGKINPLDFIQIKLIIVGKEKELTIIDNINEKVKTFYLPVKTIIAVDDNDGESIRLLGAEDMVIGVGASLPVHDIILPEMSKLPTVGSPWGGGFNYEKILELKPDLIVAPAMWPMKELEEKVEPYGIQVLLLMPNIPSETQEDILQLGHIIGKIEKAEEFVDFYRNHIGEIDERVEGLSEDEKPRVYHEVWGDYKTSSKGWVIDDVCIIAGGINIAHDLGGGLANVLPEVDPEWVIEQNPDIIIKITSGRNCGYGVEDVTEMKAEREAIMNRLELANVNAVKNGNVYVVSLDLIASGPHPLILAGYCAKWFHPDLFEDFDPEASHQEYIDKFMRIGYDVKKGAFLYPPLEGR